MIFEDCGYLCHVLFPVVFFGAFFALYVLFFKIRASLKVSNPSGKAVLITGCDSGFGKLASIRLSEKGFIVLSGCLTQAGIDALATYKNVRPFLLDVTKEASVNDSFEFVKKNIPPDGLWAIINNAGVLRAGPIDIHRISEVRLQFEVNVMGVILMAKKYAHLLLKTKGRIINVASVAGRVGYANASAYCASKFAVEGLSDSWRRELSAWGVGVVIIEPGFMKTNLWDAPFDRTDAEQRWNELTPQQKDFYGKAFFEESFTEGKKLVEKIGGDPMQVVDAMEHAVSAMYPNHRYLVGADTPMWWLLSVLPSGVADLLFGAATKPVLPQALKKK